MAIDGNELNTAELAFAAIEEVDKLQFIAHIKEIPTPEGRNAELYLYKGMQKEAESVLLQGGAVFRAIKMNIRLYKWERALELALRYKTHIDTVMAYRSKYLVNFNKTETNEQFLKLAESVFHVLFYTNKTKIEVDWQKIKLKIQQEKEKERGVKG
jgi:intraflagellar transport protein 80